MGKTGKVLAAFALIVFGGGSLALMGSFLVAEGMPVLMKYLLGVASLIGVALAGGAGSRVIRGEQQDEVKGATTPDGLRLQGAVVGLLGILTAGFVIVAVIYWVTGDVTGALLGGLVALGSLCSIGFAAWQAVQKGRR